MRTDPAYQDSQQVEEAGMPSAIAVFESVSRFKVVRIAGAKFQMKEGDWAIIDTETGNKYHMEVKIRDRAFEGDFLLEDWSDEGKVLGWAETCNAHLLAAYYTVDRKLVVLRWKKTKEWYRNNRDKYRVRNPHCSQKNTTVFRLALLSDLRAAGLVFYETPSASKALVPPRQPSFSY